MLFVFVNPGIEVRFVEANPAASARRIELRRQHSSHALRGLPPEPQPIGEGQGSCKRAMVCQQPISVRRWVAARMVKYSESIENIAGI